MFHFLRHIHFKTYENKTKLCIVVILLIVADVDVVAMFIVIVGSVDSIVLTYQPSRKGFAIILVTAVYVVDGSLGSKNGPAKMYIGKTSST